ncbi:follicle cell protein 3C-1 [Bicyclus anynana]|uniref:Follicle cell protein 3C-1 n=1 Tax=Bicyclus anynana TaxID=110368 RepID=A0A6J1NAW6_BICAN|nr:follicle cell protein 3C-1 [Bicyclus anynana]
MIGIQKWTILAAILWLATSGDARRKLKRDEMETLKSVETIDIDEDYVEIESCQCGVFMSQQVGFKDGRRSRPRGPPQGEPVVTYDTDSPSLPCGTVGFKHCISTCLDVILKYLPRAGPVICGAVERDVHREKAFLFIRNCGGQWTPTNFSAGKEFCCTDGQHHKC